MKDRLLLLLIYVLLISTIGYAQDVQLIKQADSIYLHYSDYTTKDAIKEGLGIYKKQLAKYQESTSYNYKNTLARSYAMEALLLEKEIQLDSAIVYSKKAILLENTLKNQDKLFKGLIYKRLYKQWFLLNKIDSTLIAARKALQIFKDTLGPHHEHISETIFDIGMSLGREGDMRAQIAHYKEAIQGSIAYKGEYTPQVAIHEHHLAITYGIIGYYKKELESYKKVIKRWEGIKDYKDMSYLNVAYGSVSAWYLQHGDVKTAEQYLLKQESLIKNHKRNIKDWFNETYKGRTEVSNWYRHADLAEYKRDTTQAFYYINKILDFVSNFDENDPKNNPHNLSYFKHYVDLISMHTARLKAGLIKQNKPEEVLKLYKQTLKLKGVDAVPRTVLPEKLGIVDYYVSKNEYATASTILEEYISDATKRKSNFSLIRLLAKEAKLEFIHGRYDTFDTLYKRVFKKIQTDTAQSIEIKDLKRKDCRAYGDSDIIDLLLEASKKYTLAFQKTANQVYLKNANNINELTSQIFSENFSYLPFNERKYEKVSAINEQLLNTTLLLKKELVLDDVLENIEQTGSRLSWKKFLASKQLKNLNIPDSIIEKENDLKAELVFYKKALFTGNQDNKEEIKQYKEKLYDTEIEIERLEEWYKEKFPNYFNQTQIPFDLNDLRKTLNKNDRIIKYVIAEENVYAFLITQDKIDLYKLENKNALYEKLNPFIANIGKVSSTGYKKMAQDLYTILLPERLLGSTNKQNLIFIQDDIMNLLPMELLVNPDKNYLIQSHSVSYAPSLLLWNEQLKVKKSRRVKLGIFAPTYKDYYQKNPKRSDSTALFGAYTEAMQIAKLFKSDIYSGSLASKQEFIKKAKAYTILHLAMHSTINNENVEFSNLSFSPDSVDNKLYVSELYTLTLNADLAVLSACNTGSGVLKKGDGLINVSRAFTYAGVPSIVTSLWSVPDKETSEIMVSFYTYLKAGKSKNEALQQAKLDYINTTDDEALKHPYYWAGFIVSGDVSPIESSSNNWMYFAGGFIFLLLIFSKRLFKLF